MTVARLVLRCLLAVACSAPFLAVHGHAAGASQRQRVLMFGDSLSYQAGPYLKQDFNPVTTSSFLHLYPGTALCDWLWQIDELTRRTAPDVVVLQFFGNHVTRCIRASPDFIARYGRDLRSAITRLRAVGVADIVVDVGPISPVATWWSQLVATDRRVIASFHSRDIIYAGAADAAVESPSDSYAAFLRCLPVEVKYAKCDPGVEVKVRARDKVHFCPVPVPSESNQVNPCPVYASGAYRFAHGLAKAVWTLDPTTNPNTHG